MKEREGRQRLEKLKDGAHSTLKRESVGKR